MTTDNTAEYELALNEGDEYAAMLAARLNKMSLSNDNDGEEMVVDEPDF